MADNPFIIKIDYRPIGRASPVRRVVIRQATTDELLQNEFLVDLAANGPVILTSVVFTCERPDDPYRPHASLVSGIQQIARHFQHCNWSVAPRVQVVLKTNAVDSACVIITLQSLATAMKIHACIDATADPADSKCSALAHLAAALAFTGVGNNAPVVAYSRTPPHAAVARMPVGFVRGRMDISDRDNLLFIPADRTAPVHIGGGNLTHFTESVFDAICTALFDAEAPPHISDDTQGIPIDPVVADGTAIVEAADYAQIIAYPDGLWAPLILCRDSAGLFAKVERASVLRSVHDKAAESVHVAFASETPLDHSEQRMVVCTPVSTRGFYSHLQSLSDSEFRPGVRAGLMTQTKARMAKVRDPGGDGVCKVM
jgi:hypothetical protein